MMDLRLPMGMTYLAKRLMSSTILSIFVVYLHTQTHTHTHTHTHTRSLAHTNARTHTQMGALSWQEIGSLSNVGGRYIYKDILSDSDIESSSNVLLTQLYINVQFIKINQHIFAYITYNVYYTRYCR